MVKNILIAILVLLFLTALSPHSMIHRKGSHNAMARRVRVLDLELGSRFLL